MSRYPFESEYMECLRRVEAFFLYDPAKAVVWMETVNPFLGDYSPRQMIEAGRIERLKLFISHAEEIRHDPAQ